MNHWRICLQEEWEDLKSRPLSCIGWLLGVITAVGAPILSLLQKIPFVVALVAESLCLIILLYKYIKLKSNSVTIDSLYSGNVPMVATISYIMNARKRTEFNHFEVKNLDITYDFRKTTEAEGCVMQTITYVFDVQNTTDQPITKAIMMVSKSVFSKFPDIELLATDKATKHPLHIEQYNEGGAQKYIAIYFDGDGIAPGRCYKYTLQVRWKKPYTLQEPEFFIIDPNNYSVCTKYIWTTIEIDDISFDGLPLTYLELDRRALKYSKSVHNAHLSSDGQKCKYSRDFEPKRGKVYLLKMGRDK